MKENIKVVWLFYRESQSLHRSESEDIERFKQAAKLLSIDLFEIDPDRINLLIHDGKTSLYLDDVTTSFPDVVVSLIGVLSTENDLAVLQALEDNKVNCVNTSLAIRKTKSKTLQALTFSNHGIPTPKTLIFNNGKSISALDYNLNYPVLVKSVSGTQGMGIMRILDRSQLRDAASLVMQLSTLDQVIFQEMIDESKGKAIRLIIWGEKVVMAYEKINIDSYKANALSGTTIRRYEPDRFVEELGVKTAKAFGLGLAGIDLLKKDDNFYVCDVNSAPSFYVAYHHFEQNIPKTILEDQLPNEKKSTNFI